MTALIPASPGCWVTNASIPGWPPTLASLAPVSFSASFGANGSLSQPVNWIGVVRLAVWPPAENTLVAIAFASHEDGERMKPGRSTTTWTRRTRNGTPSRIVGSGSLTTVACASSGSMLSAWRTTTVPRSNGPATACTAIARPYGAPLYGPGQRHRLITQIERAVARASGHRRRTHPRRQPDRHLSWHQRPNTAGHP